MWSSRSTSGMAKDPAKLPVGNPICDAGLCHAQGWQNIPMVTAASARNSAVPSASPKLASVPAITKTGTTARKTGVVPNTNPFPTIIVFPLIATACALSVSTLCEQNVNDITPVSKPLVRIVFGSAMGTAQPISILWLILLPLPLPAPL